MGIHSVDMDIGKVHTNLVVMSVGLFLMELT